MKPEALKAFEAKLAKCAPKGVEACDVLHAHVVEPPEDGVVLVLRTKGWSVVIPAKSERGALAEARAYYEDLLDETDDEDEEDDEDDAEDEKK